VGCGQPSEPEEDPRVRTSGVRRLLMEWDPLGVAGICGGGCFAPAGGVLLRACRSAVAVPNDIGPAVIESVFRDWRIHQMVAQDIPSGTRPKLCRP